MYCYRMAHFSIVLLRRGIGNKISVQSPLNMKFPYVAFYIFESRNDWVLTADSSWGEGFSTGSMAESPSKGKALFAGELVTR